MACLYYRIPDFEYSKSDFFVEPGAPREVEY